MCLKESPSLKCLLWLDAQSVGVTDKMFMVVELEVTETELYSTVRNRTRIALALMMMHVGVVNQVSMHDSLDVSSSHGVSSICSYQSLDASRPWLVYWIIHSLDLLEYTLTEIEASRWEQCYGGPSMCSAIVALSSTSSRDQHYQD